MDTGEVPESSKMLSRVKESLAKICDSSPAVKAASLAYSSRCELRLLTCVLQPVMEFLTAPSLCVASQVCSAWRDVAAGLRAASSLNLTGERLSPDSLSLITRRSPSRLWLGGTNLTLAELSWLLQRTSPSHLSLARLDWELTVSALTVSPCTSLSSLSLEAVTSLTDSALADLFSQSSLSGLQSLNLSHTQISDVSMRCLAEKLPSLTRLQLVGCSKLTEAGLVQLGDPTLPLCSNIKTLDISQCPLIKEISPLASCLNLSHLNLAGSGLSQEKIENFRSLDNKFKLFKKSVLSKL